jgi:EAL domain-containing protein (putative c-di-GMP-specific phosphodiesterase class I)
MSIRQRGRASYAPPDRGILYLSSRYRKITAKLKAALECAGLRVVETDLGVLASSFSIKSSCLWNRVLSEALSGTEIAAVKCRLLPTAARPTSVELMQSEDLAKFLAWLEGRWLSDLLAGGRLFAVFQPIVDASEPDGVFAYEGLIRGRLPNGQTVTPDRLFPAAKIIGLSAELDRDARITAIRAAAKYIDHARVFVNINVNSIFEPKRCLASTIAAAETSGLSPEQLVFEVVESEEIANPEGLFQILEVFRDRGFGVALDDVGAGYASLNLLARVKPDFMKLDMGLIRNVHRDPYKAHVAAKLLELAQELNVQTVVEGIETLGEWDWAREHGADFAQGYLFAPPAERPPVPRMPDWARAAHLPEPENPICLAAEAAPNALL